MKKWCEITVSRKKGVTGSLLGLAAGAVMAWQGYPVVGLGLFAIYAVVGFLSLQPKTAMAKGVLLGLWLFAAVLLTVLFPKIMTAPKEVFLLEPAVVALNFLIVTLLMGGAQTVLGNLRVTGILGSFLLLIFVTVDLFVVQYRGSEIKPADFLFLRTAINVAPGYSFQLTHEMWFGWVLWPLIPLSSLALPKEVLKGGSFRCRALAGVAAAVCLVGVAAGLPHMKIRTWDMEGISINGCYLNFALSCQQAKVAAPDGYSPEAVDSLSAGYAGTGDYQKRPDIIVIVNESFADFRAISAHNFRTDKAVTPFLDSLQENAVKGYALASVTGGLTANSEYELLTGNTMAFLPYGSCPFQQYIHGDTYSLAWALNNMGYRCHYTHPYYSSGWSRNTVIPELGFENSAYMEAYAGAETVRNYVSDEAVYQYILEQLESAGDVPQFWFAMTMQNHGGYEEPETAGLQPISLEGFQGEYPDAEQYLALLHESDRALEAFIRALEERQRDTVVLFVGDHISKLNTAFYEELNGGPVDTLEERMQQYMLPFFVWANYDIPKQDILLTSFNYLSNYLLEAAKLPLPPYNRFLKDCQQKIPAVNPQGYYSVEAGRFLPIEEATGEEKAWLQRYQYLQYNALFDRENRNRAFFRTD